MPLERDVMHRREPATWRRCRPLSEIGAAAARCQLIVASEEAGAAAAVVRRRVGGEERP